MGLRKSLILIVVVILIAMSFMMATPISSQPAGTKTLDVAVISFVTGGGAPWGIAGVRGAELWAQRVNDAGGLKVGSDTYTIKLHVYDDKSEASASLEAAKKAVLQDGIKIILGPGSSPAAAQAVGPFIQQEGAISFTLTADEGGASPDYPNMFLVWPGGPDYSQAGYYNLQKELPAVKKVSIIAPDAIDGRVCAVYEKKAIRDLGYEIVYSVFYPSDTVDFYPIVTAAMAANPDIISAVNSYPPAMASILKAGSDLGYKGYWMGASLDLSVTLQKVPASYIEGFRETFNGIVWDTPLYTAEAQWFEQTYRAKYPDGWNGESPMYYLAGRVLEEGIKAANSVDPLKIADALRAMKTVDTPMGPAAWTGLEDWGINQILQLPEPNVVIKDGKHSIVDVYFPPFPWNYDIRGVEGANEIIKLHKR